MWWIDIETSSVRPGRQKAIAQNMSETCRWLAGQSSRSPSALVLAPLAELIHQLDNVPTATVNLGTFVLLKMRSAHGCPRLWILPLDSTQQETLQQSPFLLSAPEQLLEAMGPALPIPEDRLEQLENADAPLAENVVPFPMSRMQTATNALHSEIASLLRFPC